MGSAAEPTVRARASPMRFSGKPPGIETQALHVWTSRLKKIITKSGVKFNTLLFSFMRSFEMLLKRLVIVIISATETSHKR